MTTDEIKKQLMVTIRLNEDKADVYKDFKEVVIDKLHSDVCYVTTMLMESFTKAVNGKPNPDDPTVLNFVKQNVQINMGCNFNYFTKKARRNAPDRAQDVVTDTHNLLPNVADDFPNISEKARSFWFEEFQAQGIIPKNVNFDGTVKPRRRRKRADPLVSDGRKHNKHFLFSGFSHSIVKQMFARFGLHGKRGKKVKKRGTSGKDRGD